MCRILCFFLFLISGSAVQAAETAESNVVSVAPFPPDVPRELVEAWLRLHDEELCLRIDTVFVSHEGIIQVWSRVEDEKRYKKLLKIMQPLSGLGKVEIFAAESVLHYESDEDGAPPSLWENDELRTFYRAPKQQSDPEIKYEWPLGMVTKEEIFAQRMIIFSRQTIERSENLKQYAGDLPALTHIALDPALDSDLRSLAFKICRGHARGVEKQIDRLRNNLNQALPKGKEKQELQSQDLPGGGEEASPLELAVQISEEARNIAQQVYSFIYPDSYTVELDELRNPSLLNSLMMLLELDEIYMRKMNHEVVKY
ncbi:MAG: hypothetical protein JXR49_08810 [Acidobacteria bacterium]|nr:hypothetical protein [Acidobacteriota bacterium]